MRLESELRIERSGGEAHLLLAQFRLEPLDLDLDVVLQSHAHHVAQADLLWHHARIDCRGKNRFEVEGGQGIGSQFRGTGVSGLRLRKRGNLEIFFRPRHGVGEEFSLGNRGAGARG